MPSHDDQHDNDSTVSPQTAGKEKDLITKVSSPLPFVGREADITRMLAFIRNATAGNTLSLLWIEGEAGIGKSRLLNEAWQLIDPNVLVIHCQFHPGATFSLSQSLGIVLQESGTSAAAPALHLPDSLSSVLALLRELGRLQPTLLVLEDLHLLDVKGVTDLVTILHSMEHERLGVICIAHPGSETALGAVLPFLTETIELKPLSLSAIRQLGRALGYNLRRLPNLTRFLLERTRGIPLVIWAALNELFQRREELQRNPVATIRRIAEKTEQSLTHGLTAGLSPQDLEAARLLATLGEVFSANGAAIVLDTPEVQLRRLLRAGVLVRSLGEATPLFGASIDDIRYSFSHSLLHERLLSEAPPPDDWMLELLESETPLYSTTLFVYVAHATGNNFPPEIVAGGLEQLLWGIEKLIDSPNWRAASIIHTAAQSIFSRYRKKIPETRARQIRFHLLRLQLQILNAFPSHPDFIAALDELLAMTTAPGNEEEALQRLTALEYSIFRTDEGWTFLADTVFNETEQLVEQFPSVLLHPTYIILLGNITGALRVAATFDQLEKAWKRFDMLMEAAEAAKNEEARRRALLDIAPSFLFVFRTEQELQVRKELAEKISAECGEEIPEGRFAISWPRFLESIGEMRRAKEVLQRWTPHPLTGYNLSREFALRMLELMVDAALDTPLARIEEAAIQVLEEFQNIQKMEEEKTGDIALAQTSIAVHIIIIALMRGELEWGNRLALKLCEGNQKISNYMALERAVFAKDLTALGHLVEQQQVRADILPLVRYVIGSAEDLSKEDVVAATRHLLEVPIIQRSNILSLRVLFALLSIVIEDPDRDLRGELLDSTNTAIEKASRWLAGHKLPAYLRPLLYDIQPFLQPEQGVPPEIAGEQLAEQEPQAPVADSALNAEQGRYTRISMINSISYTLPNRKPKKVRGPRPQQLLGLLTANQLLVPPISLIDFRSLVTGSESPEESANYLRVLVSRVRKQLGPDAIISDGETAPRLNPAVVRVDLIDATELLRQGLLMARNQRADQAWESITAGLNILSAGEPYPQLSGEVFVAAREELHVLLRQAIAETAQLLKQRGNLQRATELLRKGLELMPEDAELTTILHEI